MPTRKFIKPQDWIDIYSVKGVTHCSAKLKTHEKSSWMKMRRVCSDAVPMDNTPGFFAQGMAQDREFTATFGLESVAFKRTPYTHWVQSLNNFPSKNTRKHKKLPITDCRRILRR